MVVLNSTSRTSRQLFRITSIRNSRIVKVTLALKVLKFGITSPGTSRKQLSSIPLIRMPRSGRCGKGSECFTRSTSCWTRSSRKNRSDRSFIDHETSSNRQREEGRIKLFVAGLSHQTAPVELRELLAVESSQLVSCAGRLKRLANLDEIVLLSTCNRVEIYGTSPRLPRHIHSLFGLQSPGIRYFGSHVYVHEDLAAVRHLFRVAAGLDSMILGETEITGQVKQAYDIAKVARLTGGTLNRVFQTTFQAVKEIRSRTGIGLGATSVGSVAVELAETIFRHDLSKQSVIIIGAGQMGEACMRHLA